MYITCGKKNGARLNRRKAPLFLPQNRYLQPTITRMKYYKYIWEESRGDEYDYWGNSIWYFEVGGDDYISRQIVHYEIGLTFKYSTEFQEDEFGGMGYTKFDPNEFDGEQIQKDLFENLWIESKQIPVRVSRPQYELFEKYGGDIDVLSDYRTGDKRDLKKLDSYTFPLLNQIIDDKVCINTRTYNSSIVQKMNYRLKTLSPLVDSNVMSIIDKKIGSR